MTTTRHRLAWMMGAGIALTAAAPLEARATVLELRIRNDEGVGFLDTTPVDPIPGNPGTTLGEQRRLAIERAFDSLLDHFDGDETIVVEVSMRDMECIPGGGAVLGAAGPFSIHRGDGSDAPLAQDLWYPAALANHIARTRVSHPDRPDVVASFNDFSGVHCSLEWYLGTGEPGFGQVALEPVAVHELLHGVGFSNYTDEATGAMYMDIPSVFGTLMYDTSEGLAWPEMTDEQRRRSLTNHRALVWTGEQTNAGAAAFLDRGRLELHVSGSIPAFEPRIVPAKFGGPGPRDEEELAGEVVALGTSCDATTLDLDPGFVALVDRGDCNYVTKAGHAQIAGAIAVLLANNVEHAGPMLAAAADSRIAAAVTIPVLSISREDAERMASALPGLTARLRFDSQRRLGTDPEGRLRIYSPNPLQLGSSANHWTNAVSPDLVMEPTNGDTEALLDVSPQACADLGFRLHLVCGDGNLQHGEACDDGNRNDCDGCSSFCRIEADDACVGEEGSEGEATGQDDTESTNEEVSENSGDGGTEPTSETASESTTESDDAGSQSESGTTTTTGDADEDTLDAETTSSSEGEVDESTTAGEADDDGGGEENASGSGDDGDEPTTGGEADEDSHDAENTSSSEEESDEGSGADVADANSDSPDPEESGPSNPDHETTGSDEPPDVAMIPQRDTQLDLGGCECRSGAAGSGPFGWSALLMLAGLRRRNSNPRPRIRG